MRYPVLVHMTDQEIIKGEVEALPDPTDQFIILNNPHQPDGRRLRVVEEGVSTILVSWYQIRLVQLLPEIEGDAPISFVRE